MAGRQANIKALLERVDAQIDTVAGEYEKSLHAQSVEPALRIDIKNAFENLRSVLDYLASDIRERYCPKAPASQRFYFPILPDKATFDRQIDQWFPGVRRAAPAVVAALEAVQPFQSDQEWLN